MPETEAVAYRDIGGFTGYRVGDDGSVWSCRKRSNDAKGHVCWVLSDEWIQLQPQPNGKKGYLKVGMRSPSGRTVWKLVSHLVLEAFVGPRPDGTEACHDPDPSVSNNRLDNLRWDTRKANMEDLVRWRSKNGVKAPRNQKIGQDSHYAKLTEEKVREFRRAVASGTPVPQAASAIGISVSNAYKIKKGRIWTHVA